MKILKFAGAIVMIASAFLMMSFVSAERSAPIAQTAPTLIPPTLVPVPPPMDGDALLSESTIARILRDGKVRVGILYNESPFGELNPRGEVFGFDADLARSMATTWGLGDTGVEFVQVTRQTAIDMLTSGAVDMLAAALVHRRELDARIEFSQTYYPSYQAILVRNGDGATELAHMADRKIGAVMGSSGEAAVTDWAARVGYSFTISRYPLLDTAIAALNASEIDGVVENRARLERAIADAPENYRIVDDPVAPEPFAIGVRRQDINFRNLIDRTLQYLFQTGRLDEIHGDHFNGADYPSATFEVWGNVGDAPRADAMPTDVPYPASYAIARLQTDRVVRVAGVRELAGDAPESLRRADALNRGLINALARRWNTTVQIVPTDGNPLDLIASGAADLALGVAPDWNYSAQVDFTSAYLIHGLRLLLRKNSAVAGFGDLRGEFIGIFQDQQFAREIVVREAARENAIIDDFYLIDREQDAAFVMLAENNADVVLGDSLRLIPHVQAAPDDLRLLSRSDGSGIWFSRNFVGLAVPRNDLDFRLLVEYTLQELARDGELQALLQPVMMPEDIPTFEVWPGSTSFMGFEVGG
ncbi:MAG: transporter substrate-binding domain-containing protein [Chloroflexota bacterium]|nr:transporter substrate-binding domain-containing protein [Chloroflexota bacterium]